MKTSTTTHGNRTLVFLSQGEGRHQQTKDGRNVLGVDLEYKTTKAKEEQRWNEGGKYWLRATRYIFSYEGCQQLEGVHKAWRIGCRMLKIVIFGKKNTNWNFEVDFFLFRFFFKERTVEAKDLTFAINQRNGNAFRPFMYVFFLATFSRVPRAIGAKPNKKSCGDSSTFFVMKIPFLSLWRWREELFVLKLHALEEESDYQNSEKKKKPQRFCYC